MNWRLKQEIDAMYGPVNPFAYGNPRDPNAPIPPQAGIGAPGQPSLFGQQWLLQKTTDGDGI